VPLQAFTHRTRAWFEEAFAAPTPAQREAWPAIARGEHVLVSAPTGSGKTLAAFLWALDRLSAGHGQEEPSPAPAPARAQGSRSEVSPDGQDGPSRAPARAQGSRSEVSPDGQDGPSRAPARAQGSRSEVSTDGQDGPAHTHPWGTRVVYVSPLKALAYDIERNLRAPLRGIGAEDVRVGIRTGDTPQAERAAMLREPPDILVTTPESLYLMLTSRARGTLEQVEAVIVDEIHAVAHSKRGSHLALTLERLEALVAARGGLSGDGDERLARAQGSRSRVSEPTSVVQRIGLSATQNPLEEIGRFLVGPGRDVTIVDATGRGAAAKALDLQIQVPVESMTEPHGPGEPLEPVPGGEPTTASIWPAIYPELLKLVREHNSTIVFVNNRRSAERVALRLNELAGREEDEKAASGGPSAERGGEPGGPGGGPPPRAEIARAHHGSLAREERTKVEELLKAGELPCLVATSSLELGIDMGAVDLVVQIESPKSVARGLQRIGRAGHGVDEVSVGRIFPKFRGDLLECAVVVRRMREGLIEPTVVPRNALDVLAQHVVSMAVADEPAGAGPSKEKGGADGAVEEEPAGVSVDELHALVRRTHPYAELSRELLENVLDMLDGRYPSSEFGELRARIVWDRVAGRIRARRGSRQLAVANAGTIPDRGLFAVTLPDGRRVGELDEEMVYEARPGQVFLLGASTWRIQEIGRDRVIVTPAPGAPGAVPFWKGDTVGRPKELGAAIGAFSRWAVDQDAATLEREYDLDERAAGNLLAYLSEQQAATRVLPSERTIVLERFRDEIGDWRLCLLSPYGGRVHAAWGLALSARIQERFGVHAEAIWSDDGIVLHLPDLDGGEGDGDLGGDPAGGGWEGIGSLPSAAELVLIEPEEVERAVVAELGGSALFGARFRENAARALLIPRAYPGRRTPLWQQRLKAQSLLEVARRYEDFPIVLETYRECLKDVLDLPGLEELLRGLHSREISLVEVETASPSPFARSLLFDYVATYMYEGDTPSAERRAAALSLDRDLLRELLGQEELRELIDPGALERVEDDLQHRSEMTRATGRDGLHDVLRGLGDLTLEEIRERVFAGIDADGLIDELRRERRAVAVRVGGEERFIAADQAGLYRDALGVVPPGGLPEAFLADVPDALSELVARYARTHGPFTTEELKARYRLDPGAVLRELERSGEIVRGEIRPAAGAERPPRGREWCDVEVLRRLRRASLAVLRKEIEPADQRRLAAFLPSWQGIDRHARAGAGVDRLREVLVPLQGLALPVEIWERDVLPRRTGAYSQTWLDGLCASGEVVWVGAGPLGRSGRVALYFREDAPTIGPPSPGRSGRAAENPPGSPDHELLLVRLSQGPCFFTDLIAEIDLPAEAVREALWDLVWAGEVTNDAWAPLRAPHLALARGRAVGGEAGSAGGSGGGGLRGGPTSWAAPSRADSSRGRALTGRSRFAARRRGANSQVQGRWSLTGPVFAGPVSGAASPGSGGLGSPGSPGSPAGVSGPRAPGMPGGDLDGSRRRALAELLLERYGIVTREQVLAEGIPGGFASLYETFSKLETLGICRRGYFIEGMGGAQFALPGAVERLRAAPAPAQEGGRTLVIAAADPAQPYGAALPWPRREGQERRPARVAGAHVVLVEDEPVLYLERGGRGLVTLGEHSGMAAGTGARGGAGPGAGAGAVAAAGGVGALDRPPIERALAALAEAVRAGRVEKLALERIDGQPAISCPLAELLIELGFHSGPRRLTLSA
jgi:ATP-dependent Lhr-like helicase